MIVMALVFAVIYPMAISRVGFAYKDKILIPTEENGGTVYSGNEDGSLDNFGFSYVTVMVSRETKTET